VKCERYDIHGDGTTTPNKWLKAGFGVPTGWRPPNLMGLQTVKPITKFRSIHVELSLNKKKN